MKTLLLGVALLGLTVACKSNDTMAVEDASNANAPEACATSCSSKTECSTEAKAECSAEKTECSGKVCPVTGKKLD